MGYRGKTTEQNRARELRAEGWVDNEIAAELGVAKSSVSLWCRDVEVDATVWAQRVASRRNHGWDRRREGYERRWAARAMADRAEADRLRGSMSERDLFVAGIALYAGEGSKTIGSVAFPNTDPRLRVRIYLHEGLDLDAAPTFWSTITDIPVDQFRKPYRAEANPTIRTTKHPMGCPSVRYSCTTTHRTLMSLVDALLSSTFRNPG